MDQSRLNGGAQTMVDARLDRRGRDAPPAHGTSHSLDLKPAPRVSIVTHTHTHGHAHGHAHRHTHTQSHPPEDLSPPSTRPRLHRPPCTRQGLARECSRLGPAAPPRSTVSASTVRKHEGGDRATSCARWARLVASRYRWQPDELPQLGRAAPTRAPDVTAGRSAAQPSDCRAHGPHPPGARTASGAGGLRLRSQPSRLASRSRMGGRRAGEREGAGMPRRHPAARMDTTRAAL